MSGSRSTPGALAGELRPAGRLSDHRGGRRVDDRAGLARDVLVAHQKDWLDTLANLARVAVREGHFKPDMSPEQFAFELQGIQLVHHHCARLMRDPDANQRAYRAFDRLLASAKV